MINNKISKKALFWAPKLMQLSSIKLKKNDDQNQNYLDRILYNLKGNIYYNCNKKNYFIMFCQKLPKNQFQSWQFLC